MTHPTDNLLRALHVPEAALLRAAEDGDGNTLHGHFAVFNTWTEINSVFEGRFLERVAPGAFADTFASRGDSIRVLYDHGHDPFIGNKPLGAPRVLREDKRGAYYEVDLFDTEYVSELKPALEAGQLGASFRFKVTSEQWTSPQRATKSNPERLDERTITGIELYEFGPVTFPAYAEASAGLRSRTDEFLDMLTDPLFVARFTDRVGFEVAERVIASLPAADGPERQNPTEPAAADGPADKVTEPTKTQGRLVAAALTDLRKRKQP